jgi:hypothetical protein
MGHVPIERARRIGDPSGVGRRTTPMEHAAPEDRTEVGRPLGSTVPGSVPAKHLQPRRVPLGLLRLLRRLAH